MITYDDFATLWASFAAHWSAMRKKDEKAAKALLRSVLDDGLEAWHGRTDVGLVSDARTKVPANVVLECDVHTVRLAGALDADAYRTARPLAKRVQRNPVRHYCETGWKDLYNPRPDFDVCWYWSEHLDLADDEVNPLIHHLVHGAHLGLPTAPAAQPVRSALPLHTDRTVRRACLFSASDTDGTIDEVVVAQVAELARHCDVYFLADATISPQELAKLDGSTSGRWAIRHGGQDFGSWSRLAADLVGWDQLETYDEVVFANDSAYLIRPLDEAFDRLSSLPVDWWGGHATKLSYHRDNGDVDALPLEKAKNAWRTLTAMDPEDRLLVSTTFWGIRRAVTADAGFRRILETAAQHVSQGSSAKRFAISINRHLLTGGYDFETIVAGVHPYDPVHTPDYWTLVRDGYPFLHRSLLALNPRRVPGLASWKETLTALVPSVDATLIERDLLRVASNDTLQRSLAIRADADGTIVYDDPLTRERFRLEDRYAPKYDHWWSFPVCAYDHTISGNERALFEQVRDDPSIKKIILTRSRSVDLQGTNVVTVPLMSRAGQFHLARSRQIFVKHGPRINAHWPLSPLTHHFINLWHGIPLKRFGGASAVITPGLDRALREDHAACRAVITSSRTDSLAMANAFWPLSSPDMWNTGLPRNDFITCPEDRLPADLLAAEQELRHELGGRRLVLFLPTFKDGHSDAYYRFSDDDLARLRAWMERHNAVLGVREHMADRARSYWHQLAPLGSLDVSSRRYPDLEVMYRAADGLVSDYSSCLVDFMLTGRPVASFAYDLDHYSHEERGLFYDLRQVLPGPVCETFDELIRSMETFFDVPDARQQEEYAWRRRLFFDHIDDGAAARVVERVTSLPKYSGKPGGNP